MNAIMRIVSFYAENMTKMCKTEITFFNDRPPFDVIELKCNNVIET